MEMNDASYCTHVDIECSIEELDSSTLLSATRSKSETDQIVSAFSNKIMSDGFFFCRFNPQQSSQCVS